MQVVLKAKKEIKFANEIESVAKNIVAAGLAERCEIQLSYAIGVAQPTSVMVDTFGTGKLSDEKLVEIVRNNFDLRPAGIIKMLPDEDQNSLLQSLPACHLRSCRFQMYQP